MKKIMTVIGARPQFIKAAPLSIEIRKQMSEVLVHTGQHYDEAMSERFFRDLGIPLPDYNLEAGSGGHGIQTSRMLAGLEEIMVKERPDAVLVYGDTNSTLAGALAAVKLHIPVFHVESGLRSYNRRMPEEHNRVLTDHMSDLLFCPTTTAVDNLMREGITKGVHKAGDVMADAVRLYAKKGQALETLLGADQLLYGNCADLNGLVMQGGYFLSTMHRAENTDGPERLQKMFTLLASVEGAVILPAHPRLQSRLDQITIPDNVLLIRPQGYLQMMGLMGRCQGVITDSGGLQKEAYLLRRRCITMRGETEWVETLREGWNVLMDPATATAKDMERALTIAQGPHAEYYGDGHASEEIVQVMETWFSNNE